eukprot:2496058-Rhodomonas_salina.3
MALSRRNEHSRLRAEVGGVATLIGLTALLEGHERVANGVTVHVVRLDGPGEDATGVVGAREGLHNGELVHVLDEEVELIQLPRLCQRGATHNDPTTTTAPASVVFSMCVDILYQQWQLVIAGNGIPSGSSSKLRCKNHSRMLRKLSITFWNCAFIWASWWTSANIWTRAVPVRICHHTLSAENQWAESRARKH